MGVPFYGRSFLLLDANNFKPGPGAKTSGEGFQGEFTEEFGFIAYYEMCDLLKQPGWTQSKDDQGNDYAHKDLEWFGYDTVEAIERKVQQQKLINFPLIFLINFLF